MASTTAIGEKSKTGDHVGADFSTVDCSSVAFFARALNSTSSGWQFSLVAAPCAFCGLRDRFLAEAAVARAAATTYPGSRMRTGRGGRGFRR
jgi:hypothetical protein